MNRTPPPKSKTLAISSATQYSNSDSDIPHLTALETEESSNITLRCKRRRLSGEEFRDEFDSFKDELKSLMNKFISSQSKRLDVLENHILDVKTQNTAIDNTNKEIEKSLDHLSDQIKSFELKIDGLEQERSSLATQMRTFEEKIENLERQANKTSLEIRNVPKRGKETKNQLFSMIQFFYKRLNDANTEAELKYQEIRDVYRLPSKKESIFSTVVVELQNTQHKADLLKEVKKFNRRQPSEQINSSHLGFEGPPTQIFISEHLTARMKRLHFLARDVAKSANFAHCWTSNGNVYLRKQDGSPYILVKDEQQLNSLRKDSR